MYYSSKPFIPQFDDGHLPDENSLPFDYCEPRDEGEDFSLLDDRENAGRGYDYFEDTEPSPYLPHSMQQSAAVTKGRMNRKKTSNFKKIDDTER